MENQKFINKNNFFMNTHNYSMLLSSLGDINSSISQINVENKTNELHTEEFLLDIYLNGLNISKNYSLEEKNDMNTSSESIKKIFEMIKIQWLDMLYWSDEKKPKFFVMLSYSNNLKEKRSIIEKFFNYVYEKETENAPTGNKASET